MKRLKTKKKEVKNITCNFINKNNKACGKVAIDKCSNCRKDLCLKHENKIINESGINVYCNDCYKKYKFYLEYIKKPADKVLECKFNEIMNIEKAMFTEQRLYTRKYTMTSGVYEYIPFEFLKEKE